MCSDHGVVRNPGPQTCVNKMEGSWTKRAEEWEENATWFQGTEDEPGCVDVGETAL